MKPFAFRTFITLLLILFISQARAEVVFNREEIKDRIEKMDCIVKPRFTAEVESYIKGYLAKDALKVKLVLARSVTFFPIFEKYLAEHNMPDDLKYLAVVESALNPKAVSRVGATGLWQFMKETGALHGLKINKIVDERSCPHSSTRAAMEYLAKAYERFGSWELALASYNCGAGNINRAIRRAGTKDFWSMSRYLPRETRNFVPAFLGAAYIIKYYHLHGITPEYPNLDLQLTEFEHVYSELSFETIAAVTGIPLEVVQTLNPAFKKGYVPENTEGHFVMLPSRVIQALKDYVLLQRPDNGTASEMPTLPALIDTSEYRPNNFYSRSFYTTIEKDRLVELGKLFNCSGYNLKVWNNLTSEELRKGQELVVWFPKEIRRYPPFSEPIRVLPIDRKRMKKGTKSRPETPKIAPLEPVKLAPIPVREPQELPFSAMSIAEANLKVALEKAQEEEATKKTPPVLKVRQWIYQKSPFRKKN